VQIVSPHRKFKITLRWNARDTASQVDFIRQSNILLPNPSPVSCAKQPELRGSWPRAEKFSTIEDLRNNRRVEYIEPLRRHIMAIMAQVFHGTIIRADESLAR